MSRLTIIFFDIADKRRLRAVSKTLEDYGSRVQYSVFECHLDEKQLASLQQKINERIKPEDDHVRYYSLCPKDQKNILIDGKGQLTAESDFHLF